MAPVVPVGNSADGRCWLRSKRGCASFYFIFKIRAIVCHFMARTSSEGWGVNLQGQRLEAARAISSVAAVTLITWPPRAAAGGGDVSTEGLGAGQVRLQAPHCLPQSGDRSDCHKPVTRSCHTSLLSHAFRSKAQQHVAPLANRWGRRCRQGSLTTQANSGDRTHPHCSCSTRLV